MFNKSILFFFIILFIPLNIAECLENKILLKVNNEIITTIDILNEINYIYIVNSEAKNLEKNVIIGIAKNNLIKDKIKKIELLKNIEKISVDDQYLDDLISKNYRKLGFKDIEEYKLFLQKSNVRIDKIKEKIILDIYWRDLIYRKYKSKIRINKDVIRKTLSEEKIKLFDLSEILFNLNENEDFNKKLNQIKNSIKEKGFKNTASIFSISDTSSTGGDLGWIKSNSISKNIFNEINSTKIGDYTNPIKVPSGFLLLKINAYREDKKNIDINKETDRVVNIKINNQLNQFSNIFIKKLKKDLIINEM